MTIINDQDLKRTLSSLSINEQRIIASQFVMSVNYLNDDSAIKKVLIMIQEGQYSETDLEQAYSHISSLSVSTYTVCGNNINWMSQAAHFVATACKACLKPEVQVDSDNNLAWKCAMQTRMAKNCEMIEREDLSEVNEAQKQYELTNKFIN